MTQKLITENLLTNQLPNDTISFITEDQPIIIINKDGFFYKGEFIKDCGEVYKLMKEFLVQNTI
jgi:hypothetical protein